MASSIRKKRSTGTRKGVKRKAARPVVGMGQPVDGAGPLRVLCVHGVGNHQASLDWQERWRDTIRHALARWSPARTVEFHFVMHDHLFDKAPLGPLQIADALAKLLGSGLWHGIGDLFGRLSRGGRRGPMSLSQRVRWTAGMVVQWAENPSLRQATRDLLTEAIENFQPHVVAAHSLGSLISYDTLIRGQASLMEGRHFISFGSQIGNPFVRGTFGGRLVPLQSGHWHHLFNPRDDVFTREVHLVADNYQQVWTEFDLEGIGDHAAESYLSHDNASDAVWSAVVGGAAHRSIARTERAMTRVMRAANRRALLIGINDYPSEADRLEGCVNDAFTVSAALQESGFEADDIRIVLNERATAKGIRDRIAWLLDDTKPGDQRVLYYSGHGAQIPGYGVGETADRKDECLVPFDFDWSLENAVLDDEIYDFYTQLPYDALFVMILDCCHSGGMTRDGAARVRGLTPPDDIRHRALRWSAEEQMWVERDFTPFNRSLASHDAYTGSTGDKRRLGRSIPLRRLEDAEYDKVRKELKHHGPYMPLIIQACAEKQFSYEYRHGVTSYGAFTYAMTDLLRQNRLRKRAISFDRLIKDVSQKLRRLGYDQTPQLIGPKVWKSKPIPWSRRSG